MMEETLPALRRPRALNPHPREASTAFTLRDILVQAFYAWRPILSAFLLVFAIGLAAAILTKTRYTAEGRLLVVASQESPDRALGAGALASSLVTVDSQKIVQTEINLLVSEAVVRSLVGTLEPDWIYPDLVEERLFGLLPPHPRAELVGRATQRILESLSAEAGANSNIVRVTFAHPDREVAALVVNDLLQTYLAQRRTIFKNNQFDLLTAEMQRNKQELQKVRDEIDTIKRDFQIVNIEQEILLIANTVDTIRARQRQTRERRVSLFAQIAETKQKVASLPEQVFDFVETSDQSPNIDDKNVLLQLELQRDQMRAYFKPDYPPLQELEQKIETVRKAIASGERPNFTTLRRVRNPTHAFLSDHLAQLEIEMSATEQQLAELARQHDESRERMDVIRTADMRLQELEQRRGVLETIQRDYVLQIESAWLDRIAAEQRDKNVSVVQWASPPVFGRSRAPGLIAAGLVGGLLFATAVGFAVTRLRPVFILPTEAERRLGIPALASLSETGGNDGLPQAQDAIAFLATRLAEFSVDGERLKRLQIVADTDSADLPRIAAALSSEFALNHGRNVLVVDLSENGNAVLRLMPPGESGARETVRDLEIVETSMQGLFATRGAQNSALAHLRTPLPELRETLSELGQRFDMTVILAPPLNRDPIAQRLAARVDASLLVLVADKTRVMSAVRLRDALLEAGGDLLGFVMSGRRYYVPRAIYRRL